ncbi:MAG: hypothetical protein DWQ37_13655 [Planctomycetota bacterium]|nr:MAG: hypothetical protein DWQ37_13655 [Planctomycetota bacterium]
MSHPHTTGHRSGERWALALSLFTVAYNVVEGIVSAFFAIVSGSTALLGFGADSFVESLSGGVMVWQFWHPEGAHDREHRAARYVGISLLVLAAYVTYDAATSLWSREAPERSLAAILIAVASLVVTPMLYVLKRRVAISLSSRSLLADSKQTLACSLMSVALLAGAGANYWFGLWQADPVAGLAIALYLVKEGVEVLRSRELCC